MSLRTAVDEVFGFLSAGFMTYCSLKVAIRKRRLWNGGVAWHVRCPCINSWYPCRDWDHALKYAGAHIDFHQKALAVMKGGSDGPRATS